MDITSERHPWRSRAGLLALLNTARGLALTVGIPHSTVTAVVAVAASVVSLVFDAMIVVDGEGQTTPVDDPRDSLGRALTPEGNHAG